MENKVVIGVELNTKSFDKQINYIEKRMEEIEHLLKQADLGYDVGDVAKLEAEYEKLSNQLITLNEKKQKAFADSEIVKNFNSDMQVTNDKIKELDNSLDNVSQKKDFSTVNQQINTIGNGIEGVIKKVTRWGLAVFGIRSAYMFVRQAMSTLSQYNEQLGTDVEYIRFALATTLQPVIERIIQLVYTLLQYIGYIANAWFGVNIFANASAKAFNKNNKAIAGSTSNAKKLNKELQKTLAGFDEMNVLQDNNNNDSDTGGDASAGGGGMSAPSMNLENVKIPEWIQWIADNRDKVLGFFIELAAIIGTIKLAKFLMTLGVGASTIGGIIAILGGLIIFIKGIIDYLKNPTWENFSKILAGIAVIAAGVFLIFGGFPAIIAAIVGAVIALGLAIYKNWDNIKQTLAKAGAWISNLWTNIVNGAKTAVNNIKNFFGSIPSFFSGIVNRITDFFRNLGYTAGNVIGSAFKSVVNGVLRTIENVLNSPIRTINSLISTINKISPVKIGRLSTFSLPRLAKGGIVNMPSRGVPVGSAIAGERGQEGVIPLTDSQQMALLGEAIGRYITVNANITNTMNGRVISREIQRVQNNSNFAMNR